MKSVKAYKLFDSNVMKILDKRPSVPGFKTICKLIADEGKVLVCGDLRVTSIYTDNPDNWVEEDITQSKN